jgi:hypothetical protein
MGVLNSYLIFEKLSTKEAALTSPPGGYLRKVYPPRGLAGKNVGFYNDSG